MKVKIGKYKNWFGPYQLCDLLKYIGIKEDTRRWLAEKIPAGPFEWVEARRKRNVKVKIHNYDVWSADDTLALIILPVLQKLRDAKAGTPRVDIEDVPTNLRTLTNEGKIDEWTTQAAWEWVLGEMIWAFEQIVDQDSEDKFHSGVADWVFEPIEGKEYTRMVAGPKHTMKFDMDGYYKWSDRKRNGLCLFGKYYESLWT